MLVVAPMAAARLSSIRIMAVRFNVEKAFVPKAKLHNLFGSAEILYWN